MDFTGLLILGGTLTYVGITVYIANQIEAMRQQPVGQETDTSTLETWLRWLHYGLIGLIFVLGFGVFQAALLGGMAGDLEDIQGQPPEVSFLVGIATFIASIAISVFCYQVIANSGVRHNLQTVINRWGGAFDAESAVHQSAVLLIFAASIYVIAGLILQGGISGMARAIEENGVQISDAFFLGAVEIVITLLGVGLAIRRQIPETLARLGLRIPTVQDVAWGVGMGVVFVILLLVVQAIWVALSSPELLQEQTQAAEQLSLAFATLPLAFMVSVAAAVGEEIWIRGGIQPVFGIYVASIFFTLLHSQVVFTPAMFIIFGLSLGLGWLRQRYSTVAAIIAHFTFNFIQLGLLSLAVQAV